MQIVANKRTKTHYDVQCKLDSPAKCIFKILTKLSILLLSPLLPTSLYGIVITLDILYLFLQTGVPGLETNFSFLVIAKGKLRTEILSAIKLFLKWLFFM